MYAYAHSLDVGVGVVDAHVVGEQGGEDAVGEDEYGVVDDDAVADEYDETNSYSNENASDEGVGVGECAGAGAGGVVVGDLCVNEKVKEKKPKCP
jgi:hypothetical protein